MRSWIEQWGGNSIRDLQVNWQAEFDRWKKEVAESKNPRAHKWIHLIYTVAEKMAKLKW